MTTYQSLGPAQGGPNTAAADQTGLNVGFLTNQLTGNFIGKNVPQFELYHATVTGVPSGGQATIYVNRQLYSFTYPLSGSEWDPSQPLYLRPGDEVDFFWNIPAAGGSSVFQEVQSKQATSTATTCTVTLNSPTTAGNCLVVVTSTSNSTTNASVSGITLGGSAGNFGSLFVQGTGGGFAIVSFWADPNCAGGQTSVVVTTTGGSGTALTFNVTVYEVSGMPLTLGALLDKSAGVDQSTGSTSWSSGSTATTTQASELWVGGVNAGNTSTITGPASPWVNAAQQLNGAANDNPSMAGYQIASATGTATYAGSQTASKGYEAAVITLFAAAVPAPVVSQFPVVTAFFRFDTDLAVNKPYATGGGL